MLFVSTLFICLNNMLPRFIFLLFGCCLEQHIIGANMCNRYVIKFNFERLIPPSFLAFWSLKFFALFDPKHTWCKDIDSNLYYTLYIQFFNQPNKQTRKWSNCMNCSKTKTILTIFVIFSRLPVESIFSFCTFFQ